MSDGTIVRVQKVGSDRNPIASVTVNGYPWPVFNKTVSVQITPGTVNTVRIVFSSRQTVPSLRNVDSDFYAYTSSSSVTRASWTTNATGNALTLTFVNSAFNSTIISIYWPGPMNESVLLLFQNGTYSRAQDYHSSSTGLISLTIVSQSPVTIVVWAPVQQQGLFSLLLVILKTTGGGLAVACLVVLVAIGVAILKRKRNARRATSQE